jgi:DNA-binding beta-propeller fold protein YncE
VNGNTIGVAPHPNPPKLVFPPICVAPFIQGEEPTLDSRSPLQPAVDLLGLGDPFGRPAQGVPPSGLLVDNDGFFGPVPPALNGGIPTACSPYAIRQQIGHFLYVVDRSARQVKVFNSNRMTIVDAIDVPDPTDLAISGNLRSMAVTNFASNTVTIIDIDPGSPTFHTVLKTVPVGGGPRGCAFHSENEDLFVANFLGNSISVIRQLDFEPRKVITNQINRPIDVAVTPRQINFGFNTGLYFAYFLNQSGNIAVMESGPDGTNGIGYDDVIGIVSATFPSPQSIQVDPVDFNSAVWITHVDTTGRGAVSRLALTDSPVGPLPLSVTSGGIILPPSFRDRGFSIVANYDFRKLTAGFPSDTALDNLTNVGPVGGLSTPQAGVPGATQDGKTLYRIIMVPVQVSFPTLLFIANPAGGVIDVIDLRNANLLRSIPASGARHVADYWRQ